MRREPEKNIIVTSPESIIHSPNCHLMILFENDHYGEIYSTWCHFNYKHFTEIVLQISNWLFVKQTSTGLNFSSVVQPPCSAFVVGGRVVIVVELLFYVNCKHLWSCQCWLFFGLTAL